MTTIANEIPFFMSVLLDRFDYALRPAATTPCLRGPSHGPAEAGHYVPTRPARLYADRPVRNRSAFSRTGLSRLTATLQSCGIYHLRIDEFAD
jgi:hypothetical protein